MRFEIQHGSKRLIFDSDLHGLRVHGRSFGSGRDGALVYDQMRDLPQAEEVEGAPHGVQRREFRLRGRARGVAHVRVMGLGLAGLLGLLHTAMGALMGGCDW